MFRYFADNYTWDLALLITVEAAGNLSEISDSLRHLRDRKFADTEEANRAWFEAWDGLADRVTRLASADESKGRLLSAGRKYLRAGAYRLLGERMLPRSDARWRTAYEAGTQISYKAMRLRGDAVEAVNVPYQGSTLPALFIRAPVADRAPCLILFQGFDSNKEWFYPLVHDAVTRRGLHCLIVDQPGSGAAIRLNGVPAIPESERSAAACIDFLETRREVDASRIGMWGISLGGYYAPRAAAFEPRIKACAAWGAVWSLGEIFDAVLARSGIKVSMPDMLGHAKWIFGTETREEALAVAHRMTLRGVADRIRCPLLIVHGENDQQADLTHAQRSYDAAVNARTRELKVFRLSDGGAEHCQLDNLWYATDYMTDWFAEQLGGSVTAALPPGSGV